MNFLFFIYLFWKWAKTFEKLQFLISRPKSCFYLTYSAQENLQKFALKNPQKTQVETVKFKKLARIKRQNSNFVKVHWFFFKKGCIFVYSTHVGTRHGVPPTKAPGTTTRGSQSSNSEWSASKSFEFALFYLFLFEMRRNFWKTAIFQCSAKAMLLINQLNLRILWKSYKQFRVKTNIFGKFIQFFSKQGSSLHTLPM